ncbi:hypothetical protein RABR111495_24290 [Rahnella bruchi]|uniref:hypothetical protein n=1 Tax=Rahnella bruchi TaxID=1510573 RepID=UPI000EA0BC20|nr:hypothetical protein [Rahnella bruchi]
MKDELGVPVPVDELRGTAAGYFGDYLRGNVPVNQLIPKHEYIQDTIGLESAFNKNNQHLMLLTLEEADSVLNQLLTGIDSTATYAGNIKDGNTGLKNIKNLTTYYNDSNKLVFNFKGLGIKAILYKIKGVEYVKITGRAGIRRILKGTRYAINNPQVLELGIGKAGINSGIISGIHFSIWFSLAYRTIELIFKDEYNIVDFIGDITMDMAKVIAIVFVTKLMALAGGWLITAATTVVIPVALGIVAIVVIGVVITYSLDTIDRHMKLSEKLKEMIKDGLAERNSIEKWNLMHHSPFNSSLHFGG